MSSENENHIKEDFCPVCVATVPLAFSIASAGTVKAAEQNDIDNCDDDEKEQKKRKIQNRNKWIFSVCGVVGIISMIVILYFIFYKNCDECEKVLGKVNL
jgi:hypothetical protein